MAADPRQEDTIASGGRHRSLAEGDVPESLRRRYYLDGRGAAGLGFYVDATISQAAFRDRGRRLVALRTDPGAIRDMTAIARHRGWEVIAVRGSRSFRREAWLAGRSLGLEVRGYRPSIRDQQALERREDRQRRAPAQARIHSARRAAEVREAAPDQLRVVETVVKTRIADPLVQGRILAAARDRIADWLSRGGTFEHLRRTRRSPERSR